MKIIEGVLRLLWDLAWDRSGIALRWLCLAALISSFNGSKVWWWSIDLLLAWLISGIVPHAAWAVTGLSSGRAFLKYLGQYPDLAFIEAGSPTDIDWYRRFWIQEWRPKAFKSLRHSRPLRFVCLTSPHGLKLMSFINAYGTSIIVGKVGPSSATKPIEKFNLYHEIGHCSIAGIDLWARKITMPFSAIAAAIAVSLICAATQPALASAICLCALGSRVYWVRRYEYMEYRADSFAMVRLCEESPDSGIRAGEYWLRAWSRELSGTSSRRFELMSRIRWMKNLITKARRLNERRIVVGFSADPHRMMVVPDWVVAFMCVWTGWKFCSGLAATRVLWCLIVILCIVILVRAIAIGGLISIHTELEDALRSRISAAPGDAMRNLEIEEILKQVAPDDCENLGSLVSPIASAADRGRTSSELETEMRGHVEETPHQDFVSVAMFIFELAGFIKTCFDFYEMYEKKYGTKPKVEILLADPTIAKMASSSPEAKEVPSSVVAYIEKPAP